MVFAKISTLLHLVINLALLSLSKANPLENNASYLYQDAASHPVQEFLVDKKDLNANGGAYTKPTYILTVTWPRVVQYYSPSSRICQEFKPVFVEVARQLRKLSSRIPISFIAVSCAAHSQLCRDLGINAVPHIVGYTMGTTEGQVMKRSNDNLLDPSYVSDLLEISLDMDAAKHKPMDMRSNANAVLVSKNEHTDEPSVFADASQSFIYGLQKIQVDFKNPLTSFQKDAFIEWIDLLHWSLPSQWKIHNLINDIRHNYNFIAKKPSQIKLILESHNVPTAPIWNECKLNDASDSGYACGLWKLFHIISIGVSEQHRTVLGGKERISSAHVSDVMLNYVSIFFDCELCQVNFLQSHEKCIIDKCASLSDDVNEVSTNWKELTTWIWYLHNDINKRKLQEEARMSGKTVSKVEEDAVIWPGTQQCPQCRDLNGEWNRIQVFSFLFNEYW